MLRCALPWALRTLSGSVDTPRVLRRVMGHPALKEPSRVLCCAAPIGEAALVRPLPGPIALGDALVFSIACSVYKLGVVPKSGDRTNAAVIRLIPQPASVTVVGFLNEDMGCNA